MVCGISPEFTCAACLDSWGSTAWENLDVLTKLRESLGLPLAPEPLTRDRWQSILKKLAEVALACYRDADFGNRIRGLLVAILSDRHPGDTVSPAGYMTMHAAAHACLDVLAGKERTKPKPIPVSLSDEEVERIIVSLNRKPAAARALARVLHKAVEELK
jgi:hypothetical protein